MDEQATSLDDALARIEKYTREGKAVSIALCANAADVVPELVKRGVRPDMVTDQTSAHDPLHGYLPSGWSWEAYQAKAVSDPQGTVQAAKRSMATHVEAMLAFSKMGVPTFDYGNNIRQMAKEMGVENAFDFPVSSLLIFAPCSAAALARSVGWRFPAIRRIFIKRMPK